MSSVACDERASAGRAPARLRRARTGGARPTGSGARCLAYSPASAAWRSRRSSASSRVDQRARPVARARARRARRRCDQPAGRAARRSPARALERRAPGSSARSPAREAVVGAPAPAPRPGSARAASSAGDARADASSALLGRSPRVELARQRPAAAVVAERARDRPGAARAPCISRGLPRASAWMRSAEQRRGSARRRTPTEQLFGLLARRAARSASSCQAEPAPRARAARLAPRRSARSRAAAAVRARVLAGASAASSAADGSSIARHVVDRDQRAAAPSDAAGTSRAARAAARLRVGARAASSAARAARRAGAAAAPSAARAARRSARSRAALDAPRRAALEQLLGERAAPRQSSRRSARSAARSTLAPSVLASSTQASSMRERPSPARRAISRPRRRRPRARARACRRARRQRLLAADQHRRRQIRLRDAQRLARAASPAIAARRSITSAALRGRSAGSRLSSDMHQRVERGRHVGARARRWRRLAAPGFAQLRELARGIRRAAGQRVVQRRAEREQIGARVERASGARLGRDERRRADDLVASRPSAPSRRSRSAWRGRRACSARCAG